MTLLEAQRVVVQRARRYCAVIDRGSRVDASTALELLAELRQAVRQLEEVEVGARHAAKRHTEGGDW